MQQYDYLIIGQGLAGSTLAIKLLQEGKRILVIDNQYSKSSSRVAAGLFNPITGKQFSKTWKADVIFPFLFDFYKQAEKLLEANFFHPIPIYRPFESIEKQNANLAYKNDELYQHYINQLTNTEIYNKTVYNDFGGIELLQSGYVNTLTYIESAKKYLVQKEAFLETEFIENELVIKDNKIIYRDLYAEKIVFCRGYKDATSSLWSFLPFRAVKGEILYTQFIGGSYEKIINRGCWILPTSQDFYKVGATYHWEVLDETPSMEARHELVEKLEKLSRLPYKIIDQIAGVRPASQDRKPFLGQHPQHGHVYIFNGFGTKGVSLIPYFAAHFAKFLTEKHPLLTEVDVKRFVK
jgi:glycine oxidase